MPSVFVAKVVSQGTQAIIHCLQLLYNCSNEEHVAELRTSGM